ncbi:heme/hemin ABC transporter substrate-binding protein [Streptomyces noursei]|uniref:heme/hemin ABC transporter substrate-binding protein n=1 Tax=Streptomyces noursei TaxID=1971 RepID=UPI001673869E|nr:ABC transporter substrate-binding protein [Streptomyces noursei]MCZ1013494.1 ABC transporter substrate-binding protein [Streptomyces noursei]GGX35970.1 ABC transporter substrate-binding protein [Streptomyces noursei]
MTAPLRESDGRRTRSRGAPAAALALLLALAVLLTGCGGGPGCGADPAKSGGKDGSPAAARQAADRVEPLSGPAPAPALPATVRSADGHEVTVRKADRIVPLTGSLSELVYSLGLGDKVVARDITTTFAQAQRLPVVTRAHDVSAENVLALKPDVVLADTTTGPAEAIGQIRDAGIPLVVLEPAKRLSDVGRRIDEVAAALGVQRAGSRLKERTGQRLAAVEKKIPHHGDRPRVAFLYLRGSASVYLLGGAGSGADSLIEAAGGVDAGKESGLTKDFTPITSEALAKAAPDVLLVMSKGLDSVGGVDGLLKIPGVAETPAGMDRRVAAVDDGVLLNFGPRTDQVLASLVEQIHARGK